MNDIGVDVFELIQWYHTFTEKGGKSGSFHFLIAVTIVKLKVIK
jgi:hypothetical protein